MKHHKILFICIVLVFYPMIAWAQEPIQKIDSLKQVVWQKQAIDTAMLNTYVDLGWLLLDHQLDSMLPYMQEALQKAKQLEATKWQAELQLMIGRYYWYKTENQEGEKAFEEALRLAKVVQDANQIARIQHAAGVFYSEQGNNEKAQSYLFDALAYYEEHNVAKSLNSIYNDIGILYYNQRLFEKAKSYHNKVLETSQKNNNLAFEMRAYNNLGIIFFAEENYQEAINSYQNGLKINKTIQHHQGEAIISGNIAESYTYLKQYDSATKYAQYSIDIAQKVDFKRGLVRNKTILGTIYFQTAQYSKALKEFEESITLAKATQQNLESINVLDMLSQTYEKQGLPQKALTTYKEFVVMRDSLSKLDDARKLLQKESSIKEEQLKAEEERKELQRKTERAEEAHIRNMYLGILFTVIIVLILVGIGYQQKKKTNALLEEQNQAIRLQQAKIASQNEELNVTNEEIQTQNEMLEQTYNTLKTTTDKFNASVRYASGMQEALLPDLNTLHDFFSDLFIIYKPKDIVSGDFYWFSAIDEHKSVFAMADCTGHGVPGAFMSMLGCTLLHEIVNIKKIQDDPARILRNLDAGIRKILKQEEGKNTDGMDIAVCIFEKMPNNERTKITFAGAKATMILVENEQLTELKGNKIHIGGKKRTENDFQNIEHIANKDAFFYFLTDGLADQQNTQRKKFGSATIKEFLVKNYHKTLQEQYQLLEESISLHQGIEDQRDDISFIGLRI